MDTGILYYEGNRIHLERSSGLLMQRGIRITEESFIESLIALGYSHWDGTETPWTYLKNWGTLSLYDAILHQRVQFEWFDTELDSIILHHEWSRKHLTDFRISTCDESRILKRWEKLNPMLVELLRKESGTSIILSGIDFISDKELLMEGADIHMWDFHTHGGLSVDGSIPDITSIIDLEHILRDTTIDTQIYTRYRKTIQDFLEHNSITWIRVTEVASTKLMSGMWTDKDGKHLIIADDLLGQVFVKKRSKKSIAKHLDLLLTLKKWDYIVHREHGIALFHSVVKKTLGEIEREYLELHYAEWDKLFVPLTEIYRVSRYIWDNHPELTRLSGTEWERTMNKTNEEIEAIAMDILETTAKRTLAKGRAFEVFREEEKIFQEAFAYEYTLDQKSAIEEVFADMESEFPMDRLISWDVGFGKTEVAMNAIYKAVLSGTQVAVLSPLLVLADEHYETFCARFEPFGIRVGILTRMSSASEVQYTLESMKNGSIDVVVGTHRLISDDIIWKRLGLLIVDEEHKFWVTHKEKIKKIKANLDILSLSATPIPRSLNLALSGLKKISILTTPPARKKPIETIVTRWNENIIAWAIRSELERDGQVIIIHNRIRGMESMEKEISMIAWKKTRIIITHGQMPTDQIEERIHAFKKREYDILLTTTIIENGVNFLSANTIIIVDPEEFWLASLHQLRGRVGRKDVGWYCYLIYRKPEIAWDEKERLVTIANNTHLGAGFEIAMRDMEIRWAWDVLGIKQAGKSKDIWLTLYFRLLEEKVEELKYSRKTRIWTKIEIDLSYIIPDEYFASEEDKLSFYREIENIETLEELEEVESEMMEKDRKNENHNISNLFLLLHTRIILSEYGVEKLSKVGMNYTFDFVDGTDGVKIKSFLDRFDRKKNYVLLSMKKVRVETRYYKNIREFLDSLR